MKVRMLLLVVLLASLPLFGQGEKLSTADHTAVVVGKNLVLAESALTESIAARPNIVHVVARHADGSVFADFTTHNLRTTGGADWQANAMSATSARPAAANYIALTNDATAPAAGDCAAGSAACTLTSEITTNGLARVIATYAHSNGTASYTLTNTFTATGSQSAQKAAVFNAASSGTMVFEALFTAVSLVTSDTVTITWTISI
jgi:hypothetical protein